jgi:hypothetical protein
MVKPYQQRLGEWVKRRKMTRRDENTVAFLAVRDDVSDALGAGFSQRTIWANLREEKKVACSYDTFLNYVNRYIRRPALRMADTAAVNPVRLTPGDHVPAPSKKNEDGGVPRGQAPDGIAGFVFNAAPKKEDLI